MPLQMNALSLTFSASAASLYPVAYPGDAPGRAEAELTDGRAVLRNEVLDIEWDLQDGQLHPSNVLDSCAGKDGHAKGHLLFALTLDDGSRLGSDDFALAEEPEPERLGQSPDRDDDPVLLPGRALAVAVLAHRSTRTGGYQKPEDLSPQRTSERAAQTRWTWASVMVVSAPMVTGCLDILSRTSI